MQGFRTSGTCHAWLSTELNAYKFLIRRCEISYFYPKVKTGCPDDILIILLLTNVRSTPNKRNWHRWTMCRFLFRWYSCLEDSVWEVTLYIFGRVKVDGDNTGGTTKNSCHTKKMTRLMDRVTNRMFLIRARTMPRTKIGTTNKSVRPSDCLAPCWFVKL